MYEEFPHLDVDESLSRLGGDHDLLQELYAAFAEDAPKKIRDLKTANEDHDMVQIMKRAHAIKGSASAIGAIRSRELASALEAAARDEDAKQIKSLFALLLAELKAVLERLNI